MEDVLAAFENKNPSVKAETAAFLARCFAKTPPTSLNKKLLKAYTGSLLKTLNEPDPSVRDSAADALGTAMKLVGEKAMSPFLVDVDNLKMTKIKESADKAVIVKTAAGRKTNSERPNTAPPGKTAAPSIPPSHQRPKTTAAAAPSRKQKPSSNTHSNAKKKQVEKNLSNEEVDEMAAEMLPSDILSGLVDTNWKSRLAAVEQLANVMQLLRISTYIYHRLFYNNTHSLFFFSTLNKWILLK